MTCYLIGGCVRTTWERSDIWLMTFSSHYANQASDKVRFLMYVLLMAEFPALDLESIREMAKEMSA